MFHSLKTQTRLGITLAAVIAIAFTPACREKPQTPPAPTVEPSQSGPVTANDVKNKVRDALEATGQFARQHADEYGQKIKQELGELDRQMEDLRQKAKAATAEGARARETLDKLKGQSESLKQEAEKLKTAGGDALEKSKNRLNEALGRLKQSVNDAKQKVDQPTPQPTPNLGN